MENTKATEPLIADLSEDVNKRMSSRPFTRDGRFQGPREPEVGGSWQFICSAYLSDERSVLVEARTSLQRMGMRVGQREWDGVFYLYVWRDERVMQNAPEQAGILDIPVCVNLVDLASGDMETVRTAISSALYPVMQAIFEVGGEHRAGLPIHGHHMAQKACEKVADMWAEAAVKVRGVR